MSNDPKLQEKFLIKLAETADIAESLAFCNINNLTLLTWCRDAKFDLAYRQLKHTLCAHLTSDAYIAAKKAVLIELTDPNSRKEITISQEYEYSINEESGEEICVGRKVKTQTKDRAIAAWAIKEALDTSTFIKAVEKMVAEGALSSDQHKQMMTASDRAVDEFQSIIGNLVDNKESLTEAKAISLVRMAIMGAIDV